MEYQFTCKCGWSVKSVWHSDIYGKTEEHLEDSFHKQMLEELYPLYVVPSNNELT